VFADVGQRARKIRVGHGGHGDQEVIGEADGFHECGAIVICRPVPEQLHPKTPDARCPSLVSPRPARAGPRRPAPRAARWERVHCVFVFDTTILDRCRAATGASSSSCARSKKWMRPCAQMGGGLIVRHGDPRGDSAPCRRTRCVAAVLRQPRLRTGGDRARCQGRTPCRRADSCWIDCKDQVIFERDEVMTQGGTPFSVFTPYKNAWLRRLAAADLAAAFRSSLSPRDWRRRPPASACPRSPTLGFEPPTSPRAAPARRHERRAGHVPRFRRTHRRLCREARLPRAKGLSPTCRPTCASARSRSASSPRYAQAQRRVAAPATWLSELIWREFYHADPVAPPARRHAVLQARVRRAPALG
jgi:deoxyribodipyrimidine photo-lyase